MNRAWGNCAPFSPETWGTRWACSDFPCLLFDLKRYSDQKIFYEVTSCLSVVTPFRKRMTSSVTAASNLTQSSYDRCGYGRRRRRFFFFFDRLFIVSLWLMSEHCLRFLILKYEQVRCYSSKEKKPCTVRDSAIRPGKKLRRPVDQCNLHRSAVPAQISENFSEN